MIVNDYTCVYTLIMFLHIYSILYRLQGIKVARVIAGVTMSIFVAHDGTAFWCGEDMVVKGVSVCHHLLFIF